jgi:5-methyltetrahydrofolate--homocysteine methyltransferase
MTVLAELQQAIEVGDRTTAVQATRDAISADLDAQTILDAMTRAMAVVGDQFQHNEIFVPEMLIAARAMKEATAVLEPILVNAGIRPEATAVIGTVQGDLHDIGKNLVAMMWRGARLEVIDLGVDVAPARFVQAVRDHGARLVGVSALLTTTMVGMKDVVHAIRAADLDAVRVMVGGAPLTQEFADAIGADAYARDAGAAVAVARRVLGLDPASDPTPAGPGS